uniref:Uncharacterized protein n=1 Tax=Arundo donax TaxID=35708 RepID=A0A0A9HHP8_ARUDO
MELAGSCCLHPWSMPSLTFFLSPCLSRPPCEEGDASPSPSSYRFGARRRGGRLQRPRFGWDAFLEVEYGREEEAGSRRFEDGEIWQERARVAASRGGALRDGLMWLWRAWGSCGLWRSRARCTDSAKHLIPMNAYRGMPTSGATVTAQGGRHLSLTRRRR